MSFEALVSAQLWAILALFGVIFLVRRVAWRLRGRFGFYPSGAALGNALQRLQVIAQPEVRYVIREKEDEEADEEDSGDPDHPSTLIDPIAHLHRQARRIRRGEEVDRITAVVGRAVETPAAHVEDGAPGWLPASRRRQIRGSLHCAGNDETVPRFGRDDGFSETR